MKTPPSATRINVVIPMAGAGSRFTEAGYAKPKPFIDVNGKPMIVRVVENLAIDGAHYVLIGRREHAEREPEVVAKLMARTDLEFVFIENLTEGTACTVLSAEAVLDPDIPMVVANSDQLVVGGIANMIDQAWDAKLDGSIMVFTSPPDPKWSYAKVDCDGRVLKVAEKVPISDLATVGVYYISSAKLFSSSARAMIAANERVNNEFYTCPVYNYLIAQGGMVGVYEIEPGQMIGLGTPEELHAYLLSKQLPSIEDSIL